MANGTSHSCVGLQRLLACLSCILTVTHTRILAVTLTCTLLCTLPAMLGGVAVSFNCLSLLLPRLHPRPLPPDTPEGGGRRPDKGQPSHHSNHSALEEYRGEWE